MIKKWAKAIWSKTMAKVAGATTAVAVFLFGVANKASAAVDPAVASTTQTMVLTMKDNMVGVITTNISNIVIVGVIIFSLGFVWRLSKRFMK